MQRGGLAYFFHNQYPSLLALLYNILNIVTKIKYTNFKNMYAHYRKYNTKYLAHDLNFYWKYKIQEPRGDKVS
jgi:hypothetical protein